MRKYTEEGENSLLCKEKYAYWKMMQSYIYICLDVTLAVTL